MRKLRKNFFSETKYPKFFIEGELAMLEPSFNLLKRIIMYYKRGKGARYYRNSGFRSYGCLMSLILFPLQIIFVALKTIIQRISKY